MKRQLLLILLLFMSTIIKAQISMSVTGTGNTTPALAGSYSSLAAALNDLNNVTAMSGPVVFTMNAGSAEVAPATGLTIGSTSLNAVLSATNTVTFTTTGPVTLFAGTGTATPASATPDGILKIVGADWITISGLTFTDGNTTNPESMEFGLGLFKMSATDGAQNNTIQNCTFNMQIVNNAAGTAPMPDGATGILVINATPTAATTAVTPTAASGTNSYNKFYANTVAGGNTGIALRGYAATTGYPVPPLGDLSNDIGGAGASGASTGNTIINYGGGGTTSAAVGIRATNQWELNISNNNIDNNNGGGVSHGAAVLRGIYGESGTSANVTITYNTVSVKKLGTTQALTAIENAIGGTAANNNTVTISNNTIQNCTYTTATTGTFTGILAGATATNQNVNNNTIINNTIGASGTASSAIFQGIYSSVSSTNFTANSNTLSGNSVLNSYGTMYCIRASTSVLVYNGNTISNNSFPNNAGATSASLYGFYDGSSPVTETYTNNNINNLTITGSSTATANAIYGIYNTTAVGTKIFTGNNINNFSFTSSSTGYATVAGIRNLYNTVSTISKNIIYNLSSTGATPTVAGIYLGSTSATTFNVFNNYIGNLSTPSSTGNNLTGIYCGSVGSAMNISYNTIYLNTTSTAANFGCSAIYMSSTTPTVTLKNNILVNLSTPTGTGQVMIIRRTATALTAYGSGSNNNVMYAGTPSASNVLYYDGTNSYQTLASLQAAVTPRETMSWSVLPPFLSVLGSDPNFLHIDATNPTLIESGGTPVSGITDDYDGDIRNTTYPDIGADEFNGVTPVPIITGVVKTPANPQCAATSRTMDAHVVSAGLPVSTVTLNYNNGAAGTVSMNLVSGTTSDGIWTATIPAASPANTNVTWSITATDGVYTTSYTGASYKDAYLSNATTTTSANPATICSGSNSTLSVTTIDGNAGTTTVGTNTTTVSTTGNPLRAGAGTNWQIRTQMLILASELSAANLSAGAITSLSFITNSVGGVMSNFTLKMGHTTSTSLTSTFATSPMTTVFTAATYTHVVGTNTYVFSTPFIWDGVSNVIIEVCETNSTTGTIVTQASTLGYNATTHAASTTGCSDVTGTTYTTRPVIILGGIIGTNYTSTINYTWTPGGATGSSITVAPTSATTYTATGIDGNGCTVSSTPVTVTTNPLPSAPSATNSTQCGPGTPTASVASTAGANGTGNYFWYDAATAGNLLQGQAFGPLSVYYTNDFSSSTLTNSSISGAASIAGGVLTLQTAIASSSGGFTVNASGNNSNQYVVDFDMTLTSTGTTIADGLSYSFADDALATTSTPTAEHGSGSKLRIGFFTYNAASGSDGKGIYLMYNIAATTGYTAATSGVLAYSSNVNWIPTSATSQTSHVTASINAQGKLTLTVGGTPIFTNVQLPAAFMNANKATWKHVFSSRSGGVAGGFGLDNVTIQANSPTTGYTTYQNAVSNTTTFYVSELGTGGCESPRTPVTVTVSPLNALATSGTSSTMTQNDGATNTYASLGCNPIMMIADASGGNTLGSVTASVTVDGSVQNAGGQPYLQRHYQATVGNNSGVDATVTLYATQAEFDAYNLVAGSYPLLPTGGVDNGNVRISKFTGSTPVTGTGILITPVVTWNATNNWWEMTFPVSSFSSFYIHTGTIGPLSIQLLDISAANIGKRNRIDWQTASEKLTDQFELERSLDGRSFTNLGTIKAKGKASVYSYWDEYPINGANYYRLKMIDASGDYIYSKTVKATVLANGAFTVDAYPNPVLDKVKVEVRGTTGSNAFIQLTDVSGKLIRTMNVEGLQCTIDMNGLASGVYFIRYSDDLHNQTVKINKQ